MRKNNRIDGSMTVYLSMILTCVIAFFLALLSLGKVLLMEYGVREDLNLSFYSVLAEYDRDWVRDYGLFMVPGNRIEKGMRFYLSLNSHHMMTSYSLEELSVTETGSLQDTELLKAEIVHFMEERGALSLLEKMLNLLLNLQETEGLEEVSERTAGSQHLATIQTYYGDLITCLEGIRDDGSHSSYGVKQYLKNQPSQEEVVTALDHILTLLEQEEDLATNLTEAEISCLERMATETEETKHLCQEALVDVQEILSLMETMKAEEEETALSKLPFSTEELTEAEGKLEKNQRILSIIDESLGSLLMTISNESYGDLAESIYRMNVLLEYRRDFHFPYEYRQPAKGFSLTSLLSWIQGYPDNIGDLAPKDIKDLRGYELASGDNQYGFGTSLKITEAKEVQQFSLGEEFVHGYLVTEYLLGMFRNFHETVAEAEGSKAVNLRGDIKKNRFFQNEVEYVLIGGDSEYKNVEGVRRQMIGLRALLNAAYLLTNPEKRAEIESVSSMTGGILLPGVGDAIAFSVILTVWSLAEATNDYHTLLQGEKVPLWKTEESWSTQLSSLMEKSIKGQQASRDTGLIYEDYLRILLYMAPRNTRLGRIQTLLSANHAFMPLQETVVYFAVEGTMNGPRTMTFSGRDGYVLP